MLKRLTILLSFLMTLSSHVAAQDARIGAIAAARGNYANELYANELQEWKPKAEDGDSVFQFGLGLIYRDAIGVYQDHKEAVKWFRLASEQGHTMAQNSLGFSYENGHGVPQDNVMAYMWFNIAAANGDTPGGTNREIMSRKMTLAAIEKAQAMARECMSSGYTKCGY